MPDPTPATSLRGAIHVAPDPESVAASVAEWIIDLAANAISARGRFVISLAGGSTPKVLYAYLALPSVAARVEWAKWWCVFGDERACSPDDPSANYHMARTTLLDHVSIPAAQVLRMPADADDLDAAAAEYSEALTTSFGEPPVIDCVLLGLGTNGHTASLFPGTAALDVDDAWCARGLADYEPVDRLTLTYPTLNAAREVAFLVTGTEKAQAFADVIAGTVPAAHVNPADGRLSWWLDSDAWDTVPHTV